MTNDRNNDSPPDGQVDKVLAYLYDNSNPKLHYALAIVLWTAIMLVFFESFGFVVGLIPGVTASYDRDVLLFMSGCLCCAEVVREYSKYWLGYTADQWCFPSMALGGAAFGFIAISIFFLMLGPYPWAYAVLTVFVCSAIYVFLGWLIRLASEQEAKRGAA